MGRWMEESKLCVYLGCRRAFLGRRGSGKAPLEDQRHSQQRPEGNKIQRSGRKTSPEQSKKHKKKLLKISPPRTAVSPRNPTLNLSEMHCLHVTVRILHFVRAISNRSSWERTMVAGAAKRVPQKQFMYNKHSHRKIKKICSTDYSRKKVPETTLCPKKRKKRYGSPLPRFSFQTIKGTPDWPLGSTFPAVPPSLHKCCRQKRPVLQNNKKKGKVKVWFLFYFF